MEKLFHDTFVADGDQARVGASQHGRDDRGARHAAARDWSCRRLWHAVDKAGHVLSGDWLALIFGRGGDAGRKILVPCARRMNATCPGVMTWTFGDLCTVYSDQRMLQWSFG